LRRPRMSNGSHACARELHAPVPVTLADAATVSSTQFMKAWSDTNGRFLGEDKAGMPACPAGERELEGEGGRE